MSFIWRGSNSNGSPVETAWRALGLFAVRIPRLYALNPGSLESKRLSNEISAVEEALFSADGSRSIDRASVKLQDAVERHAAEQQQQFDALLSGLADSIRRLADTLTSTGEQQEHLLDDLHLVEATIASAQSASSLDEVQHQLKSGLEAVSRVVSTQLKMQEKMRAESESATRYLLDKLNTAEAEGRTDPLTRVGNRTALEYYGRTMQSKVDANEGQYALAVIDLDGFKQTNDRFGHAAGDEVLRIFVQRLRPSVSDKAFIARTGGDEFVVVAPMEPSRLMGRLMRLLASFDKKMLEFTIDSKPVKVSIGFSFGVAAMTAGEKLENAMKTADQAMYEHKRDRKSGRRVG